MRLLIFALTLLPLTLLAQDKYARAVDSDPHKWIDPDPYYWQFSFYDYLNNTGVKTMTMVSIHKSNGFKPDTTGVFYYDQKGRKVEKIDYRDKIPYSNTRYWYDEENNLAGWEYYYYHRKTDVTITLFYYDARNILINTRQIKLKDNDTSSVRTETYEYDSDDNLVSMKAVMGDKVINDRSYRYEEGRLILSEVATYGRPIVKECTYNDKGQLISLVEKTSSPEGMSILSKEAYEYDANGLLIKELALTSSNLLNEEYQVSNYAYNEKGQMTSMEVFYKDQYRKVAYEYVGDKVSEINVTTNTSNGAYLKFWIDSKVGRHYTFPIEYKEQRKYDKNLNIIERKVWINSELFSTTEYQISYY